MVFVRLKLAGVAATGLLLALAGCQSGDTLGALNVGGLGGGGGESRQQAEDERITSAELLAYCPAVTVTERAAIYNSYQRGGDNDPSKLVFRAAITDATRSCTYSGGTTGMTIAVAGRIIPGPAGTAGSVRMPIRITVYQDADQIYSQRHDHEVAVADTVGATQFMFVDRNFSMPNPTARNVRVLVGYDETAIR